MNRALAIAIGVALVVPAQAFARPRVAIVAFEGDKNNKLGELVAELLEGELSLVGPRQVSRAMDKLELDADMSAKQLKKLANELEADSIVRGDLSTKGPHKLLHIRLYVNGKRVRGFKVEYASAKSAKFKEALRDKLLEKLGGDAPNKQKKSDDEESDEAVAKGKRGKKAKAKDDEDAEDGGEEVAKGKRGKKAKGRAADEDDEEGDEDDEDSEGKRTALGGDDEDEDFDGEADIGAGVTLGSSVARGANRAAVRVEFGPSLSARTLRFTSRSFEEAPKPYKNSVVPGGRLAGELYPLALVKPDSVIAGIGISGEYDKTVGLDLQSTAQPGTRFPVRQSHLAVGGRFRYLFGRKPTSPSVTLGGGYMNRFFKVDRSKLVDGNILDLPDVGYKGYNVGLDLRFPIVPAVAIFAGGRGIFVTTTGAIQTNAQYGQAKVTGAEAQFGIDVSIGRHVVVRLVGEGTQMGFEFTGTGQMAINRDGDPETKDVGGAADRYIGGAATFGVLY